MIKYIKEHFGLGWVSTVTVQICRTLRMQHSAGTVSQWSSGGDLRPFQSVHSGPSEAASPQTKGHLQRSMWEFTVGCTSSRVVYAGLGTASLFWCWIRKSGTTQRLGCRDPKKLADQMSWLQGCEQLWYEQRDEVWLSMSVLWWLD